MLSSLDSRVDTGIGHCLEDAGDDVFVIGQSPDEDGFHPFHAFGGDHAGDTETLFIRREKETGVHHAGNLCCRSDCKKQDAEINTNCKRFSERFRDTTLRKSACN